MQLETGLLHRTKRTELGTGVTSKADNGIILNLTLNLNVQCHFGFIYAFISKIACNSKTVDHDSATDSIWDSGMYIVYIHVYMGIY